MAAVDELRNVGQSKAGRPPRTPRNTWRSTGTLFTRSLVPLISRIRLDTDWYLATYPDVKEAIADNVVANAGDHYRRYGYFEHRIPYRIMVEDKWYLEQYPDVKEAIVQGTLLVRTGAFRAEWISRRSDSISEFRAGPGVRAMV